jgi:glycosyltransferase involved in cell wall biosynthesis
MLGELMTLRDRLGLAADVIFLGFREDTAPVYKALDFYVHPAHAEGLGTAVLEAMAHGLPVVATAAGGPSEVVRHRETGLLVPAGDARAFAEAVLELARDPALIVRLGAAARIRIAEQFSMRRMVEAHERLYQEVCR